ncbi:MAG: helix-turn-helix transcriptional regulator [Haloarculaceae archaeon]
MGGPDRVSVGSLVRRRAALLARLDETAAEKPTLAADLAASRSTVDRAIRELEAREYVRRGPDGYETTLAGRLARQAYEDGLAALDAVLAGADLLADLPADAPLSIAFLRGADVHRPARPAPREPLDRLRELIDDADRYCGFTTAVLVPDFVDDVLARVAAGALELEFVYDEPMADYIREEYDEYREALRSEANQMYVADGVPYGLGILYGEQTLAYVIAEGPDGGFRGLLVNDDAAAVAWAEAVFESYRSRAEAVDA